MASAPLVILRTDFCRELAGADGSWAVGIANIALLAIGQNRPKFPQVSPLQRSKERDPADVGVAVRASFAGE
jgi:hypothetical protein